MTLLNTAESVKWLKRHARIGNSNVTIDKRFLKRLENTGRLFPDKQTLFGNYYDIRHLRAYADDVKPR